MKLLKNILLLLFVILSPNLFSQNTESVPFSSSTDTIGQEIMKYTDTQAELISKGRRLLLDRFTAGDIQKVKEVKDYLKNQVENRDYLVLYPPEHWLILYWTREFNELINSIRNPDAFEYIHVKRMNPQQDILLDRLKEKSLISIDKLTSYIHSSELTNEDQDFLVLYLNAILSGENPVITQDQLNGLADDFLQKYPGSQYSGYVRENIRFRFAPSKWGYAYEFFSGYGVNTGNLKKYFSNNIPFGVAFDVQYKNLSLYLRDYIGFSKTRKDITNPEGTWKEKSQVRVYIPEASLGYVVKENDRVKLAPFAGIGGVIFSPTENDIKNEPFLQDVEVGGFSYMAGMNLDIKLGKRQNDRNISFNSEGFGFIRLRYSYCSPRFSQIHDGMTGNMHYITIGIGAFGRSVKRVK